MPADSLKSFCSRFKTFADNYQRTAEGIIKQNGDKIADLQAKQLAQGINSKGKTINPPYKSFTIEQKKKKRGLAGEYRFVTYFDTGELYKALQVMVSAGKFTLTANTFKFEKAEERSGVNTFGLTTESGREFRDHVALPEMQKAFEQQVLH